MAVENIDKCPACGSLRKAMEAVCPECGYTFGDSRAKIVEELGKRLYAVRGKGDEEIIEIIKNFHIPHIVEELLDLMYFIQPRALEQTSPVSLAWRARQREIFERAKKACATDKRNLEKVIEYERQIERLSNQRVRNTWAMLPKWAKITIPTVIVLLILLLIPAPDESPEAYARRFVEAVSEKSWDEAIKHLNSCPEMGQSISSQYLDLVEGLLAEDRAFEAEQLFTSRHTFVSADDMRADAVNAKFIEYYLSKNQVDMAMKHTGSLESLVCVMRYYIEQGDGEKALALYRRNSTKFSKYDFQQHRKVSLCKDEVVTAFLAEQGIQLQ